MKTDKIRNEQGSKFRRALRPDAPIVALTGALGSIGLMLRAGRGNSSVVLIGLFTIWVLSPFVGLVFARAASKRWAALTRATPYGLTLFVTLSSLAVYGYVALGPPRAKPAAAFLVVPFASWLLIAIAIPIAATTAGRRSRRGAGA